MFRTRVSGYGIVLAAAACLTFAAACHWEASVRADVIDGRCVDSEELCPDVACQATCRRDDVGQACRHNDEDDRMKVGTAGGLFCNNAPGGCNATMGEEGLLVCQTTYKCTCQRDGDEYVCKKQGSALESVKKRKCVKPASPDDPGGGL